MRTQSFLQQLVQLRLSTLRPCYCNSLIGMLVLMLIRFANLSKKWLTL